MSKRESGTTESFWLWTGDTEYDGQLLQVYGTKVMARVRRSGHWKAGTLVPLDLNERQRGLTRRIGFGQSPAILGGSLFEFRVVALQPCRDPQYEITLSGTFWPVADVHLDPLSKLESNEAFRYLQKNSSRAFSPSNMRTA
jgi:hypothetical protein